MIPAHPLADLFPMLGEADAASLAADIGANGLRDRIVILDGQVLDGRNRLRAAVDAGVLIGDLPPDGDDLWTSHFRRFVPAQDGDPLAWVLSKNLHRRHLNDGQRAMIAERLATLSVGRPMRPDNSANLRNLSVDAAAEQLHVSPRSVTAARAVRQHGAPELIASVERGEVAVSAAEDISKLPVLEQMAILRNADPRAFRTLAAEKRRELTGQLKQRREERVEELAAKQLALPTQRYGLIYADPEWEHRTWSDGGMHKAAANIYPVSSLDVIKARDVASIAADDCVLFMWTTVPHLEQSFEVMRAWGFAYKSSAVWHKQYPGAQQGMGYWFRINHEILLVGTRGKIPAPAPGTQFGSVIVAPVGAHSEKPAVVHEMIEALYGALPKIELNARARRAGWDAWGFEAPNENSEIPAGSQSGGQGHSDAAAPELGSPGQGLGGGDTAGTSDTAPKPDAVASASGPLTRMPMDEAKAVVAARYDSNNGLALSSETGWPLATIRVWAFRAGKTDRARLQNNAAHLGDHLREKTQ